MKKFKIAAVLLNSAKNNRLLKSSALAVLCATMVLPAQALTVYKSVGKFGEVKYSQFPPESAGEFELIELRSDGRQMDSGKMDGKTDENQVDAPSPEEERIAQLEAQMEEQKERENAQRCQTLRNKLLNLNTGGRIYEPAEDGSKRYLDGPEIESERERTQETINQYCLGGTAT